MKPAFKSSIEERNTVKYAIAWNIVPLDYSDSTMALHCGLPQYKVKQYLRELLAEGTVMLWEGGDSWHRQYCLPPHSLLECLVEIARDKKRLHPLDHHDHHSTEYWTGLFREYTLSLLDPDGKNKDKRWKKMLEEYVSNEHGRVSYFDPDFYKYELDLVSCLPMHKGWNPLYHSLPKSLKSEAIRQMVQESDHLLCPFPEDFIDFYSKALSSSGEDETKDEFLLGTSVARFVLSGRIESIPAFAAEHKGSNLSHWLMGFYWQRKGDPRKAALAYQQAGFDGEVSPILVFNYAWFLHESVPGSKNELTRLKRRNTALGDEYLCASLLISKLTETGLATCLSRLEKVFKTLPYLSKVLIMLVLKRFNIEGTNLRCDVQELLRAPHLRLLALDCGQYFDFSESEVEELERECGTTPLFPFKKKPEPWEMAIEEATACIIRSLETKQKTIVDNRATRIIYVIDKYFNIIPKVQTRKGEKGWTNGRKIILSSFKQGKLDMSELDRSVSKTVVRGWDDHISSSRALPHLVGHPLVFDESGNPLCVRREDLQVTLSRTAEGRFKFEANVGEVVPGTKVYYRWEKGDIVVTELSAVQMNFFCALGKVEDFPPESEQALRESLSLVSKVMVVQSEILAGADLEEVPADSRPNLFLKLDGDCLTADFHVMPFGSVKPVQRPGEGSAVLIGKIDGKDVKTIRDLEKEKECIEWVKGLLEPLDCEMDKYGVTVAGLDRCLEFMDIIGQHLDRVKVEWRQGKRLNIASRADFSKLSMSVNGLGHWFQIQGELQLDDGAVLQMRDLLGLLQKSEGRFVELSDGQFLALTDRLRKQLSSLSSAVSRQGGDIVVPSFVASLISKIGENGAELKDKDSKFSELMSRVDKASKTVPTPSKKLKAELRDYQLTGFRWLSRLSSWATGAVLSDDMGLGKTIQAISLLLSKAREGASLVIAPASVMPNWKRELRRFAPSLNILALNETGADREKVVAVSGNSDIVLTTYGVAQKEEGCIAGKHWNIVVLDEAHAIKNSDTKTSQAIMRIQSNFNVLLTGTPVQNNLLELWNLFNFATPGLLGSREHFLANSSQLKRLIQPFILRRTKEQVLEELPPKTEITMSVELSDGERALYESLRRDAQVMLDDQSNTLFDALSMLTKLRLACCHPSLVQEDIGLGSSKSDAFVGLAEELIENGHRALVFSQFTSHLALVRDRLDSAGIEYLYFDGSTPLKKRSELVEEFQKGEAPLFLISLRAGGLGINLTAADFVIHLDPWWNPAIEDQASDRAHRIGQTKPVTVYRLIARDTVEERIMELHESKKKLSETILSGSGSSHSLTRDDLLALLG